MTHIVSITIQLFLLITFLQSGIDKIVDWKGNVGWLKEHFAASFMGKMVPLLLVIILILEVFTALCCITAIYALLCCGYGFYAILSAFSASVTLLLLLFGQRVAKDYQGALTITCYFIVAIFGLYMATK